MPCKRWPESDILASPILRPGPWMSGDRTATQRHRRRRPVGDGQRRLHGTGALPAEITKLGQELSMSARLVTTSVELRTLAEGCDDPASCRRAPSPSSTSRPRAAEHDRLAVLDRRPGTPARSGDPSPMAIRDELLADLDTIDALLCQRQCACWLTTGLPPARSGGRLRFHLCGLDMRQIPMSTRR